MPGGETGRIHWRRAAHDYTLGGMDCISVPGGTGVKAALRRRVGGGTAGGLQSVSCVGWFRHGATEAAGAHCLVPLQTNFLRCATAILTTRKSPVD
jgi:hypothetical protein